MAMLTSAGGWYGAGKADSYLRDGLELWERQQEALGKGSFSGKVKNAPDLPYKTYYSGRQESSIRLGKQLTLTLGGPEV